MSNRWTRVIAVSPEGKLYGKVRYVMREWKWETRETSATDCRDCLYFNRRDGICEIDVYKENLWDYCEYFLRTGAMTLKEIRNRFAKQEDRDRELQSL